MRPAANRVQRRAQFVGHDGEELVLGRRHRLGLGARAPFALEQLVALQLAPLALGHVLGNAADASTAAPPVAPLKAPLANPAQCTAARSNAVFADHALIRPVVGEERRRQLAGVLRQHGAVPQFGVGHQGLGADPPIMLETGADIEQALGREIGEPEHVVAALGEAMEIQRAPAGRRVKKDDSSWVRVRKRRARIGPAHSQPMISPSGMPFADDGSWSSADEVAAAQSFGF